MENKIIYDNNYVLTKIQERKNNVIKLIITELKGISPLLDGETLLKLYDKCVSIHQKKSQGYGDFLENIILVPFLEKYKLDYKQQVSINDKV